MASNTEGQFYNGISSQPVPARISFDVNSFCIEIGDTRKIFERASSQVFSRVGNIPRRIKFEDGSMFETIFDLTVDFDSNSSVESFATALEKKWKFTIAAILGLIGLFFIAFKVVIPHYSAEIATHVPHIVSRAIEKNILSFYTKIKWIAPSELSPEKTASTQALFDEITKQFPEIPLKFSIYSSKSIGPNAFALPAGQIIVMDDLIKVSTHPDQIRAVIYHEIGHVHFRHGLQAMIKSSAVTVMISTLFGDATGVGIALGLISNSYSREMERAADHFSATQMRAIGKDPSRLIEMFEIIEKKYGCSTAFTFDKYVSSHPPMSERIKSLKEE